MPQAASGHAAFEVQTRRELKEDQMLSRSGAEISSLIEFDTRHRNAAFAGRTAGGERHGMLSIFFCKLKFAKFDHAPNAPRENAGVKTANNLFMKSGSGRAMAAALTQS
jgi:hypothetical protein